MNIKSRRTSGAALGQGLIRMLAAMACLGAALWPLQAPAQAQEQAQRLPTTTLSAGMHRITAQVAQTHEQRATGLMFRKEMPAHEGMLFVFEQPAAQCFWMKNTFIPLSIAFLDEDGTIVNIEKGRPHSLDSVCSARPVRFVLEMNEGWFARKGLGPGARLGGAPFRP